MIPNSNQEMFFSPYSGLVPNYHFKNQIFQYNFSNQNPLGLNYYPPNLTSPPITGQYYDNFSPTNPFEMQYTAPNKINDNPLCYQFISPNKTIANYKYPKIKIKTHNEINRNIKLNQYFDQTRNNQINVQKIEFIPVKKNDLKQEKIHNQVTNKPVKAEENLTAKQIPNKVAPIGIKATREEIKSTKPSENITASKTDLKSEYECLGKNIPPISIQKFRGYFNFDENRNKECLYQKITALELKKNINNNVKPFKLEGINGPNVTSIYLNHTASLKEQLRTSYENQKINIGKNEFKNNPLNFKKIDPNIGESGNKNELDSNFSNNSIENINNQKDLKVSYGLFGDQPNSNRKSKEKIALNDEKNLNGSYILI